MANDSSRYANFVYDAWMHPKVLSIISRIAGVDLVPSMDYEIGHVNVSVKSKMQKQLEAAASMAGATGPKNGNDGEGAKEADKPIVDWHTDSYPFVCVLMMSDASSMTGGETALRAGTGDILKVRGPQMVSPFSFSSLVEFSLTQSHRDPPSSFKVDISNIKP